MLWLYVVQFNLVYFIWNNLLLCDILEVKVESLFVTKQSLPCDILEVKVESLFVTKQSMILDFRSY